MNTAVFDLQKILQRYSQQRYLFPIFMESPDPVTSADTVCSLEPIKRVTWGLVLTLTNFMAIFAKMPFIIFEFLTP